MDNEEVSYAAKNKNAILFLSTASEDYIGARVLFLNGVVVPGYVSAQQAIEKILKCYILLLSPNENLRDKKKYPSHNVNSLLQGLSTLTGDNFAIYESYCFILTKAYYCMRYPEKEFITDFSIFRLSTESIDQLDELFLFLFVKLPMLDSIKCRLGPLGILLLRNDANLKNQLISNNKAYLKWINFFSKPLEWWRLSKEDQAKQPSITITAIQGVECCVSTP